MDNTTDIRTLLIDELDLADLAPEQADEIVARVGEQIMQRVIISVLDQLSEEDKATFTQISESKNAEDMQKFLAEKIPNLTELIQTETRARIDLLKKDK